MIQTEEMSQDEGSLRRRARSLSLKASVPTFKDVQPDPNSLQSIRAIVRSFVQRVSSHESLKFDPPPTDKIQAELVKELETLNIDLPMVQKLVPWACQVAEGFYPFHPMDLKVLIAMIGIVFFYIDDRLSNTPDILYTFQLDLLAGRDQFDPILECLSKILLPRMWKYYHPLAANAISIGFYELIQGTAMESITKTMKVFYHSAPEFPNYVRLKSGDAVSFAYLLFYNPNHTDIASYIQIMPDFADVIDWVNDILSFYKEELAGEDDNLIHMRAKTSGKSVVASLDQLCEESLLKIDRISETLSESPEHLGLFKGFMAGYVRFHTSATRYRLKELMAEDRDGLRPKIVKVN